MKSYEKLGQLTSLRFVAAAMVVTCHMTGLFGFAAGPRLDSLVTGVSFFFVLSGFILAHVYPDLSAPGDVSGFLRARIARIWPGHVATFLLAIWLLRLPWDFWIALPNLFLIQAWNPFSTNFYSYNSPSWSLSTELFFYLAFPYLILHWKRQWPLRVLLSGTVLVAIIAYVNSRHIADAQPAFLYVNPAARIFEFIFGMLLQLGWQKYRGRLDWSFAKATALELGTIGCCALSIYFTPTLAEYLRQSWAGAGFSGWIYGSGSMFAYGLTIFVMALGRGGVSRFLTRSWFVTLGEISFAIYLLHQIFLRFYLDNIVFFPKLPNAIALLFFWTVLLVSSYVMWTWVEMPARRAIIHWHPSRWLARHWQPRRWFIKRWQPRVENHRAPTVPKTAVARRTWRELVAQHRGPTIAALVLACLLLVIWQTFESIRSRVPAAGSPESQARTTAMIGRLMNSLSSGDQDDVRWLLDSGVSPNGRTKDGQAPLIQAAWLGDRDMVELLLANSADPNLRGRDGIAPLMAASMQGHPAIIRRLAAAGASVNVRSTDGTTPLIDAATRGDHSVVSTLLALGANPNAAGNDGYTALIGASMHSNLDIVTALVQKGARINDRAKDGSTPLMIAAWAGNRALVNTLLSLGADPSIERAGGYSALIGAVIKGDPDIVRALAGKSANLDATGAEGNTPLMIAAWAGNRIVVDVLISFGANVNVVKPDGLTAIMLASMGGHSETVELLARKGAKVNVTNAKGATPLMNAAWAGKRDLVELLLSLGADAAAVRKDGRTALDLARMGKHPDIVALLASKTIAGKANHP